MKFEKALTAPAEDDSWELWIQTMVETGKKFVSHTKALHTTEETRRANFRRRQRLRQQLGETAAKVDAHSQELWTAFHFRIRELGRKLRAASRRAASGGSPTGCKGEGSQTVRTAGKERARSERQALHSRGSFTPVAGRGEKLVGVPCSGRWDVGKNSS